VAEFAFAGFATYAPDPGGDETLFRGSFNSDAAGSLADGNDDGVFDPDEALTISLPAGDRTVVFLGVERAGEDDGGIPPPGTEPGSVEWIVLQDGTGLIFVPLGPLPEGFAWPRSYRFRLDNLDRSAFLVCFLAGTRIATPGGEVAVEDLRPGDVVLTADGRAVPVLRVGRQEVATAFVGHDAALPVEIAAGALAEGVPARPLRLTPDHALLLDGVLVQAGALVNGTTVRRMAARALPARFPVVHVETPEHVALLADGAAAESYIANVPDARMAWRGAAQGRPAEMAAPRALSARQVPRAILRAIAARAAALGGQAAA
jgi:hypothetical protein